jgi:hypothetical protein
MFCTISSRQLKNRILFALKYASIILEIKIFGLQSRSGHWLASPTFFVVSLGPSRIVPQ